MVNRSIYFFIGTTAELIKLVPVIKEFNKRKICFTVIASGQNDIRFEEFAADIGSVPIMYAVTPKGKESSLFLFFLWTVRAFFSLLLGMRSNFRGLDKSNSFFIVHGDTISSLIGSLVASIYGLNLVHIESGLRSMNFFEPFPEEISRYIISKCADVHFCPNEWSLTNLTLQKGIKINTFQNTLIETFHSAITKKSYHPLIKELNRRRKKYFVLVEHRQEHVLFGRKNTTKILEYIFNTIPENIQCIFLVHDLSSDFIRALSAVIPQKIANRITRVGRLPYGDFMHILEKAQFLITDGGSNQEEMYYMGKPCLLLRNHTERIEGLHENVILSNNDRNVIKCFIENYMDYKRPPVKIQTRPSKIITDYLTCYDK